MVRRVLHGLVPAAPRRVGAWVPQAFWNPADEPARLPEIISPARFEQYFADLAEIFATPGAPDPQRLAAAADHYGLDIDLSSIPRLAAAFGLQVAPPDQD